MKTTLLALIVIAVGQGCSRPSELPFDAPDRIELVVEPRAATPISGARYALTAFTPQRTLWRRTVEAPGGLLRFDGPCDPSPEAQPNRLRITLERLDTDGRELPRDQWFDPTPVELPITCEPGQRTLVPFELPIALRSVDGTVSLDDVFCAAKFDCRDGYLDPAGPGDLTGILGFSCTAGFGVETTLFMTDITVTCDGRAPVRLHPSIPGQRPIADEVVFTTGTYHGRTSDPTVEMCYWNTAIGLSLDRDHPEANPTGCHVSARGVAVEGGVEGLPIEEAQSLLRYPVIAWDVPLTDATGAVVCADHPLAGTDGRVAVSYTDLASESFRWPYECGEAPKETCAGRTATERGTSILLETRPDGAVQIEVGGASKTLVLPEGVTLEPDIGCCVAPCCDVTTP
jgi:hypothetical protein